MRERSGTDTLAREKQHHDRWAHELEIDQIMVKRSFEASTAPENRFILRKMGKLEDKRLKGARCTATDYSNAMLHKAKLLARKHGVTIETRRMNAEKLNFPDGTFDYVYAANLLHHVRAETALREMHRVCKPGGQVCFWDPLKHNPIINVYRQLAHQIRSPDEAPLDIHFIDTVRTLFSEVSYETFWFLTLWIFVRFYLVERVSPNDQRYWKKILYEERRLRRTYMRLEWFDRYVKKLRFMERFAWNIAVVAMK
jgi:SAM-dependent methyltransferase